MLYVYYIFLRSLFYWNCTQTKESEVTWAPYASCNPLSQHRGPPSRGEEVIVWCSCLSSLSFPLNSWPLTGTADVRAALGTRLSLLFLAVSFPLPASQLFLADVQTPPALCRSDLCRGRLTDRLGRSLSLRGVSVWYWHQRGLKGSVTVAALMRGPLLKSHRLHLPQAQIIHQNSLLSVTCRIY